jgi:hypothetical protein
MRNEVAVESLEVGGEVGDGDFVADTHSFFDGFLNPLDFGSFALREIVGELLTLYCLHGGDLEEVVGFVDFIASHLALELHLGQGLAEADHGLQLADGDGDGVAG